jgi:RHS repeat-associated protein
MSPGAMSSAGLDVLVAAIAWADDNSTTLGVTSFKFDALEQLRSITPPNTTAVNHTYDPLGRRLSSPTGALQYSGTDIRPVIDGANRYQPGPAGVVAVDDMAAGGGVWAHTDGHTDVVGTFSAGATQMAGAQAFSPWGERLGATGAASPLGYQSERQDLPGGLIGMGAREYDPDTGTFISRDPAADSNVPNGYSYTSANPLGYTDPTGECQMEWVQGRWQRWLGGWLARPTIGGAGSINTRARGCTWQQFGRYSQVDAWCEQGRIWCKHVGDHLIIDSRLYMWVWCGDARGCWFPPPKPPPAANNPPPNNPPPPNNNPPPHGPGGGGSGGGGSGGDGGSPAGGGGGWSSVGGDQNVIANPPPAPPSPTQQQVAATGSAVPNYNGRYQVDQHTGQVVDTGAASIATAPSSPTSVSAAPVSGTSTPGMTISNVEVGIGGMSREDFFIGRYCAHHHREDASCWNGRAAQNSRDFRVIADAISAQQDAARAEACRRDWWCNFSSSLSTPRGLVELASAIPVVGEVADAGLCAWDGGAYLFNGGSRSEAAWSCLGMVPEVGSYLRQADNVTDAVRAADAAADMSHYADEAAGVTRYVDDVVCAANSFVPGTRVLMADGTTRAIEDVGVGDRVWAEDPETEDVGPRQVTAVITGNGSKDLVDIVVVGDIVTATDGHPFWIDDEGHWVRAEDLAPGDVLRSADGDRAEIAGVGHRSARQQVYNLSVDGIHTYFVKVGDDPVLVHNSNCFDGFDAIENLDDYGPGQGFSGVYDPASGQMATRPSVEPGAASPPAGSVSQYGGHGQINSQLGEFGVDQSQTVGFTVVQQTDGSLEVRWRSRSVNSNNWGSIDAPDAYRQEIIDAVAESTGRQVTG